jgi:hypothetical protein
MKTFGVDFLGFEADENSLSFSLFQIIGGDDKYEHSRSLFGFTLQHGQLIVFELLFIRIYEV